MLNESELAMETQRAGEDRTEPLLSLDDVTGGTSIEDILSALSLQLAAKYDVHAG